MRGTGSNGVKLSVGYRVDEERHREYWGKCTLKVKRGVHADPPTWGGIGNP